MRHTIALVLLGVTLLAPRLALAQRTLAQDTMSMASPVAVECGFCAAEAYGVVFQRLSATSGLLPSDFPLSVQSISLALGAAEVTGTPAVCHGIAVPASPETLVHVEIWAGTAAPDAASIATMPVAGMAWPGEDLVIALDDVPVTMSTPTTDGAADFNLMLNTLALGDTSMAAPVVDDTHTYLRAVVVLNDGGMSSTCTPNTNAPTGFPLRDDDGVIMNHRSFIYATGVGWLWNEMAGVHGDWGIRLDVQPLPHADAGVGPDAGRPDAGVTSDAATTADAGSTPPAAASCGCRVGARSASPLAGLALAALALAALARRRP